MVVTGRVCNIESDFYQWKKRCFALGLEILTGDKNQSIGTRRDLVVWRQQGFTAAILIGPAFVHANKFATMMVFQGNWYTRCRNAGFQVKNVGGYWTASIHGLVKLSLLLVHH